MTIDFRRTRIALLLALTPLVLAVCPPALAQQNAAQNGTAGNGNAAARNANPANAAAARPDDDETLGPTEQDHGDAMDADAAGLRGAPKEDLLLGAPDPYGDPYRRQFDNESNGTTQSNLINSESVPMNGTAANRKQGAKQLEGEALAGKPAAQQAEAQAQPRTPTNAAKSVYRGAGDPVNPDKQPQIYRSPW
jgi:hypothetical protein